MRALILAFAFEQNYHVLRLARDAGYQVHVLGKDCAEGLKHSLYCASYQPFAYDPVSQPLGVALETIKRAIERVSADVVLPSDVISTRLLSALQGGLPVACYPLPSPAVFDVMNNKWEFFNFCRKNDIPVPDTWLFPNAAALKDAIARGEIKLPIITKPLAAMSQKGIYPVPSAADMAVLDKVDYEPVLVQRFIDGPLVDISIIANQGKVAVAAVQKSFPDRYAFLRHERLLEVTQRLVAAVGYHGVAHFDAIEDAKTGELYFLECNPRFWFSIFAARNGGLNFVEAGLKLKNIDTARPLMLSDTDVLNRKPVIRKLLKLGKLTPADKRTLSYFLADLKGHYMGKLPKYDDDAASHAGSINAQVDYLDAVQKAAI